jgi:hypothetical protein
VVARQLPGPMVEMLGQSSRRKKLQPIELLLGAQPRRLAAGLKQLVADDTSAVGLVL